MTLTTLLGQLIIHWLVLVMVDLCMKSEMHSFIHSKVFLAATHLVRAVYYSTPWRWQSIVIGWSVSLCVCVSICLCAIISPKQLDRSSRKFLCMSDGAVAQSSSGGVTIRYYFQCYGWLRFVTMGLWAHFDVCEHISGTAALIFTKFFMYVPRGCALVLL